MSGRIRTIKPEWLEDEALALASDAARVLSVALLLLADDHGNGRANEVVLGGRVFPGQGLEKIRESLAELSAIRFVLLYEVDGQKYFHVRNWSKHQKVDKPGKPRVPPPTEPDNSGFHRLENSPETLEKIRETVESSRASRGSYVPLPGPDPGPDPDPGQSRGDGEAGDDRETVCPLGLIDAADRVGMIRELAEWANVPDAVMRHEATEFLSYWTIGAGMGRKRRAWMRKLREHLRRAKNEGRLKPPGAIEHRVFVAEEQGLSPEQKARALRIKAELAKARVAS